MKNDMAKWIYFKVRKTLMSFLKRSLIFSPNTGKTEKKEIVRKRSMDSNTSMTTTTKKSKTNKTDPLAGRESHALSNRSSEM